MAETHDITIRRRANYALSVTLKDEQGNPRAIPGYIAAMQLRPSMESRRVIVSRATEDGSIAVDEPNGIITAHFTHQETRDLAADAGVYDMLIKSPEDGQEWVIGGNFIVENTVTRVSL